MPIEIPIDKWPGAVRSVTLGAVKEEELHAHQKLQRVLVHPDSRTVAMEVGTR